MTEALKIACCWALWRWLLTMIIMALVDAHVCITIMVDGGSWWLVGVIIETCRNHHWTWGLAPMSHLRPWLSSRSHMHQTSTTDGSHWSLLWCRRRYSDIPKICCSWFLHPVGQISRRFCTSELSPCFSMANGIGFRWLGVDPSEVCCPPWPTWITVNGSPAERPYAWHLKAVSW